MRRARSLLVVLGALLLVSACVTPRPAAGPPLSASDERTLLTGLADFSFDGRTAIINGETGTNASLAWQQTGEDSLLRLSGPLGMGSMRVTVKEGALGITTSRGETLDGARALAVLQSQLGFEPPLDALRHWVLGVPAPGATVLEQLDADGRLARLEQQGWLVTYDEYRAQSTPYGSLRLPRRITATRDALRLRVVIDRWALGR